MDMTEGGKGKREGGEGKGEGGRGMSTDVFDLHNVDYSEKGMELEIIVEGQRKLQTVVYSALDYLGEKWYYTEEGHR